MQNGGNISTFPIDEKEKHASFIHVYFLGIMFVIGDLVVSWNHGLKEGLWEYLLANALVGLAYLFLTCCQAEMTSMLPFSGGTYGFTRVTMGPFAGYLVGCFEVISNWMFVVETVEFFGDMIHHMVGGSADLQPVYWLFFYFPALAILLSGSKYFWPACVVLGILSLFLVFLFLLAAAPQMDTEKYVTDVDDSFFTHGMETFLTILPLSSHVWLGLQSISLACEDTKDATTVVPHAFLSAVVTLFFISFIIIIAVTSHPPGIREVEDSLVPMNFGYAQAFGIVEQSATVFSLFAVFGVALSHMFAFSRQLLALARSRLVSKYFSSTLGISDAPAFTIIVGSVLSYGALLLVWGGLKEEVNVVLHSSLVGVYFVYAAVFVSWYIFKTKYTTMPRKFLNPFGYFGMIFGLIVFILCLVGTLAFQTHHTETAEVSAVIIVLLVAYYFTVANKTQTYSAEEQNLLLKLYVIKGNAKKRKNKGSKGSKVSKGSKTSLSNTPRITRSKGRPSGIASSENDSKADDSEASGSELSDAEGRRSESVGSGSEYTPVVTGDVKVVSLVIPSGTGKTSSVLKKVTNALVKGVSDAMVPNFSASSSVAPKPVETDTDVGFSQNVLEGVAEVEEEDEGQEVRGVETV